MPTRLRLKHAQVIIQGLLIGILAGLVVSAFRWLITHGFQLTQQLYRLAQHKLVMLWVILAGNLLIALIVGNLSRQQPHIMGSGIPEVEGQLRNQLHLAWWPILWRKFLAGILSLSTGLILGREGPSIQLGAAVGQGLGQTWSTNTADRKVLLAAGAAGGLAAAFNAPLASTFFVLEEIYHNFSPLIWMSSLASSLSANLVASNIFGLRPVLHLGLVPSLSLKNYWSLLFLGLVLGVLGYAYQWVLLKMPQFYYTIAGRISRPFQISLALLFIIPLGFWRPELLGGGNQLILQLPLTQTLSIGSLVIILLVRFGWSMLAYGSGAPGGIFLPILSLGALAGFLVARCLVTVHLLPASVQIGFIVWGMAGLFAGISKAPFTAILLITEMVGSLKHLMPLAIVALVAYVVVDLLGGAPIYDSLLNKMLIPQKVQAVSDNNQIFQLTIFAASPLANQQIRSLTWPPQTLVLKIIRGEHELLPQGDTLLQTGDILVISTNLAGYQLLQKQLPEDAKT